MMKWSEDWDRRSSSLNCRTLPEAVAATIPARLKSQCEAKDWDFVVIFCLWIFQKEAKRSGWPVGASFQHFTSPKRNLRSSPPHLLLKYYPNPYLGPIAIFVEKLFCFFSTFCLLLFGCPKVGASEARFAPIDLSKGWVSSSVPSNFQGLGFFG